MPFGISHTTLLIIIMQTKLVCVWPKCTSWFIKSSYLILCFASSRKYTFLLYNLKGVLENVLLNKSLLFSLNRLVLDENHIQFNIFKLIFKLYPFLGKLRFTAFQWPFNWKTYSYNLFNLTKKLLNFIDLLYFQFD